MTSWYGKIHVNCEKNTVKAFKRDLTTCKLQFVLRLRLPNNSNLATHNSLVTSDLPWHKSRSKILTTVHSQTTIASSEQRYLALRSQLTTSTTNFNTKPIDAFKDLKSNYLQLASLGIKHFLGKGVE